MSDAQMTTRIEPDGREAGINGGISSQNSGHQNTPSMQLRDDGLSDPLNLVPEEHSSNANLINSSHREYLKHSNHEAKTHRFDPNFTQSVINATGPKASPRMRKVVASLVQHVHDFARENEITVDEWMAGVEMVYSPFISRDSPT